MKVYLRGPIAAIVLRLLDGKTSRLSQSQALNLSGIWKLKLQGSDFGRGCVPNSIEVTLVHKEPSLRYSGTFVDQDGKSISFDVKTRLDGRPTSSTGATVISRRIDAFTTTSEWKSDNPPRIETTIMTVSPDCSVLAVKRHVEGTGKPFDCTERYEKQVAEHASPVHIDSIATDLLQLATLGADSPSEPVMAPSDGGLAKQALAACERPTRGRIAEIEMAAEESPLSGLAV